MQPIMEMVQESLFSKADHLIPRGIEIPFNHTCIPSNGCIYEDNTLSLENNDTQMKAIQTQE